MDTLHSTDYSTTVEHDILSQIYDTLMYMNPDGSHDPEPRIAESYEISDDGLDYTFHLRNDVTFHNGTPLTAKDVKFSLELCKDSEYQGSMVTGLDSVETPDDYTVVCHLSNPYSPFMLGVCQVNIASKDYYDSSADEFATNPVGSGPYKYTGRSKGSNITLEAYDGYYRGEAPIKEVNFEVIPDQSTTAIALQTGEVNFATIESSTIAQLSANPNIEIAEVANSGFTYVSMNTEKEPFNDVKVRQAINYALDKQTFVDTIIEGRGLVANSYINAAIPGWTDEVEAYPYDPEKAKELLAEAGYPDGFECSIFVNGDLRTRSAQILQAQLADVGIKVDISTYEWGALLDTLNAGEHEMFLLGWSNTSFDPDGSTYQLFYSGNHGATGNRAFFSNDKVDELILSAQRESEESKRMELYKELQFVLHDESPWCPLYYKNDNVGVRADLKGFKLHKGAQHYLGNCHYED